MKERINHTAGLVAISLLAGYLLLQIFGSFREFLPTRMQTLSSSLSSSLFPNVTPAPGHAMATSDCNLEFRNMSDQGTSDWKDASGAFGFSDKSVTERIEQDLCEGFRWQVVNNLYQSGGTLRVDRIMESTTFINALYFVSRLHRLQGGTQPDSLQLRLNYRFTPTTGQAYTFQRSYLEFPAVDLP